MTDKDIIKALECCSIEINCRNCPIHMENSAKCVCTLLRNAHDLITRQQAEIENLKVEKQSLRGAANSFKSALREEQYCTNTIRKQLKTAKSEAVKEFADKVAHDINAYCEKNIRTKPSVDGVTGMKIANNLIYRRLREMVGEKNGR